MTPPAAWRGAGATDRGHLRTSNQDAFAILNDRRLWVVADGMGGGPGGDIASRIAVDSFVAGTTADLGTTTGHTIAGTLTRAMQAVNETIRAEAARRRELTGMGTTLVAVHISSTSSPSAPLATVAHVGDSRAYLIRGDRITALTRDHSWVEEQVRRGIIPPAHAAGHPMRHVLSRALGSQATVEPDVSSQALQAGDRLLLCTDGLTKMLADDEILEVFLQNPKADPVLCQALVDAANRRGGEDNVTVVVIGEER